MALGSPPRQHAAGGLNRLLRAGTAANQQQQQQASNTGDTAPSSTAAAKKIMLQKYLTDCRSLYSCLYCRTHLANHDELISRSFQGNRSRAYLFNAVINITAGPAVQRELNTGSHAVADIFCTNCGTTIGWKYERAYVDSQKYKEGKFIIELAHVVRENRHLELDKRDRFLSNLQHDNSISLRASQLHSGDPTQAPTVGQLERGSLSPPSSSPSGSGWSSSPGSTSGGFCWARVTHEQRRDNESDEEKEEEEKEEEEVLMFPFHDDLFGERASYSNLCGSRLSCRRRDRRSLHLDSAPYDWKLAARPLSLATAATAAAAPTQQASPTSPPVNILDAGGPNENERPNSTIPRSISTSSTMSEGKHEDCSASSSSSEVSSSVSSAGGDSEIQFELEPCASPPTAPAPINKDCDRTGGTGEPGPEADAPGRVRDDEDEQERRQRQASGSASGRMGAGGGGGGLSRNHSLSLDEEEFYDCCTDHQVSNLSTVFAN